MFSGGGGTYPFTAPSVNTLIQFLCPIRPSRGKAACRYQKTDY
jgi:hypothetical protein